MSLKDLTVKYPHTATRGGKTYKTRERFYQPKECEYCGERFSPNSGVQKYCEEHSPHLIQQKLKENK